MSPDLLQFQEVINPVAEYLQTSAKAVAEILAQNTETLLQAASQVKEKTDITLEKKIYLAVGIVIGAVFGGLLTQNAYNNQKSKEDKQSDWRNHIYRD